MSAKSLRQMTSEQRTDFLASALSSGGELPTEVASQFIEIAQNANDFQITSDKKILVTQYMQSQGNSASGDPAMTTAVEARIPLSLLIMYFLLHDWSFVSLSSKSSRLVRENGKKSTARKFFKPSSSFQSSCN